MRVSLIVATLLLVAVPLAHAANPPARSPELQALDIATGKWVFQGTIPATPKSKASGWTWNADCNWSANQMFLICSFTNNWGGKIVKSLVVDTYNANDKSYWHYEMLSDSATGARPFISKMSIKDNVWTETGESEDGGKKVLVRIIYRYTSPTHVTVKLESSGDQGAHWVTESQGIGSRLH